MRPGIVILAVILVVISLAVIHRQNRRLTDRTPSRSTEAIGRDASTAPVAQTEFTLGVGEHSITLGERKYLIYIPAKYQPKGPTPLVLFFHGGGGWMEQAAADYGWKEKADKEGFVVAFPNGSSRLPRQRLATWNAGNCCGYARDQKIDDIGFTRQVVADIERQVNIDPKRIYATGMSNGGILSHRIACELADTFAAVASVAGTDGDTTCQPSRPISVMHIHAKDDDHVLFNGGAGEGSFRDETKVADFVSVEETIRRWIVRNQADPTPVRVLDVPGAYADRYTSKLNPAVIELVVTETGGHSWPGGKAVRGKKPSTAINADDVIWSFFQSHPMP